MTLKIKNCVEGDCENGALIRHLDAENLRLRDCLGGTRSVIVQIRDMAPDSMKRGFDLWLQKIDEVMNVQ